MSNAFPTGANNYTGSETLTAAGHAQAHNAYESKIGIGASTPTSSTVLRGNGTGTSIWGQVVLTTDVTGILPNANGGLGKVTLTQPASAATLTILNNKTLTANNTLTFAGTDSTTITFQGTDTYVGRTTTDTLTNKTLTTPTINAGSDAQGDILYRSSGGTIARLAPGTSGQYLKTQGAAANPIWADVASGAIIRLARSADLTVSTGTETAVGWDTEDEKSGITHDTVTNNSRITIVTAGRYLVTGTIRYSAALGAYESYVVVSKNGTDLAWAGGGATNMFNITVSRVLTLAAADYIELYVYQASGGNKTLEGSTQAYKSKIEVTRLP